MKIQTSATVVMPATAEQAYDLATDMSRFPEFFKGAGPIPAVLKVESIDGAERVPGARRNVHNSDGSVIVEEVIEMRRPELHAYRLVSGFKPPFSLLVGSAKGEWTFTPVCNGTRVDWHYEFNLTSPLAWPLTAPIIRIFFTQAMQDCLDAMQARIRS